MLAVGAHREWPSKIEEEILLASMLLPYLCPCDGSIKGGKKTNNFHFEWCSNRGNHSCVNTTKKKEHFLCIEIPSVYLLVSIGLGGTGLFKLVLRKNCIYATTLIYCVIGAHVTRSHKNVAPPTGCHMALRAIHQYWAPNWRDSAKTLTDSHSYKPQSETVTRFHHHRAPHLISVVCTLEV